MQTDFNSILLIVAVPSLALNAWFLRGVARDLRILAREHVRHESRLSWLEARANGHPRRRTMDFTEEDAE